MVDSFETRDVSTFHLNFFWLLNSVMQKNNIFYGFRLVLCILIYFHTRIQTFTWTVIETVFLYFIFFIDLWTVTYFFFKYVHDSRKSFLELQQSNNLKKNNLRYFESVYMHEQEYNKYHTRMKWQKDWTYIRAYTLPHPSPPLKKKKPNLSYPNEYKDCFDYEYKALAILANNSCTRKKDVVQ